eukprot:s374_g32.t2
MQQRIAFAVDSKSSIGRLIKVRGAERPALPLGFGQLVRCRLRIRPVDQKSCTRCHGWFDPRVSVREIAILSLKTHH